MTTVAEPPRFLVTGGTGFIGRRLVRQLVAACGPSSVVCLVKAPVTALEREALDWFRSSGVQLIEGDLLNRPVAVESPPPVDAVFHLAANIDTDAPDEALRVNHEGTRRLLEWLAPISRGMRLIYASSVAVHDRAREPDGPISETSPLTPRTGYGRTKLAGEAIVHDRSESDGYSWTVLRLPTVYGPGQKPKGLFDQLITMASDGAVLGRINWPGRTSIVHVDDVAAIMIDVARLPAAAGEVYCVASDESLTVGEIARRVGAVIGRPVTAIEIPAPLLGLTRMTVWNRAIQNAMPGIARLTFWRLSLMVSDGFWFDTTKFRRVYTKPLRTLEEGLADTIRKT
jgi:nucleoside-diphosphate-sugar epimerase